MTKNRKTNAELDAVDAAIIAAVEEDHPVSLRGVFYRCVSAGAVEKTEDGYRLVGRQLGKLRKDEIVPWTWIVDGTRATFKPSTWSSLDEMLGSALDDYRRALWDDQAVQLIVLSEKDAISGVVYPVTSELDVPLGIVRGYSSLTFAHDLAETCLAKPTIVYQLGDHDPSGVDALRSFEANVRQFAPDADVEFERLAVTPDQITDLRLETRPTKSKDPRAAKFRGESVEVDAIPAGTLRAIIRTAIESHIDQKILKRTRKAEQAAKAKLAELIGEEE